MDEVNDSHATTQAHGDAHATPKALGLDATGWVALAMLALIGIILWKKVPAAIGKMLDGQIADIRKGLDEAATLRAEAEKLKNEYEARRAGAEAEARTILESARADADAMVANARTQAEAVVARRTAMAEGKIAAAERSVTDEVRAVAARAATQAAAALMRESLDTANRDRLVDQAIGELDRRMH
jgi:F-type H+-transporting ATPase subunit b